MNWFFILCWGWKSWTRTKPSMKAPKLDVVMMWTKPQFKSPTGQFHASWNGETRWSVLDSLPRHVYPCFIKGQLVDDEFCCSTFREAGCQGLGSGWPTKARPQEAGTTLGRTHNQPMSSEKKGPQRRHSKDLLVIHRRHWSFLHSWTGLGIHSFSTCEVGALPISALAWLVWALAFQQGSSPQNGPRSPGRMQPERKERLWRRALWTAFGDCPSLRFWKFLRWLNYRIYRFSMIKIKIDLAWLNLT